LRPTHHRQERTDGLYYRIDCHLARDIGVSHLADIVCLDDDGVTLVAADRV
jgi:hypothetical protein